MSEINVKRRAQAEASKPTDEAHASQAVRDKAAQATHTDHAARADSFQTAGIDACGARPRLPGRRGPSQRRPECPA